MPATADSKTTNSNDIPAPVQDGRRWDVGQTIQTAKEGSLIVTAVHYQEDDKQQKVNFTYTVQHQDDAVAEQKAAAEAEQVANPEEPEVR